MGVLSLSGKPDVPYDTGNETNATGHWIITYTGARIEPLDPNPTHIHIEDIAHSLANQCRFTGHVRSFYSTAQHCVLGSYLVPDEYRLAFLLHDGSEAYISDIASPVKNHPDFGTYYSIAEERLERAIAERFRIPYPMPPEIKVADKMMLRAEQRDLMPNDPSDGPIWDGDVVPWSPYDAERQFLSRYVYLTGESVNMPRKKHVSLWTIKRQQRRKD
jgi:hypothetical protein